MYAVVEFERKECAVVPLNWLTENQNQCYWPRNIKGKIGQMILLREVPKQSWSKHKVVKLLNVSADYQEASSYLEKLIDESSSSTSTSENFITDIQQQLTKKTLEVAGSDIDSDENELSKGTPASKENRISKSNKQYNCGRAEDSSDDFSEEDHDTSTDTLTESLSKSSKNSPKETQLNSCRNISKDSLLNLPPLPPITLPSVADRESFSIPSHETANILDLILRQVEHIKAVQDQQCIKLDNIERNQQTSVIQQLQRPSTMPNLPVSNKNEYKILEEFLADENNALYMRRRLAAIGGSSVRNTVMNILKFVLTNKVGMKFNWSGRDKRPFKETRMVSVINEAVKLSYSGREPSDLTDTDINNAVKDWLKLAKHRYIYSSKKR